MNIITVCYPTAGGSGVVATELARAMSERGHRVHLVATELPIRLEDAVDNLSFHRINIPSYDLFPGDSYGMAATCTIREILEDHDVDLVHVHYAFPHALSAYLAADLAGIDHVPIITTLHGTDIFLAEDHPCHFDIVRSSLEKSGVVTAVSEFLKQEAERIFDTNRKIRVIPNFVDAGRFKPREGGEKEDAKENFCSRDECLLVHVSNYRPIKRSEDMVRILRYTRESGAPAHLLMIGNGPERERVKGLLGEFHMREHVSWVDTTDEVESYMSSGDILVVTSEQESFSMAALEAMACGLPVLNVAEGGIRELVRDGTDGTHFEEGRLVELSAKAAELHRNRDRLAEMGENARKRVEETFSKNRVVPVYEDLYREVLRDPSLNAGKPAEPRTG